MGYKMKIFHLTSTLKCKKVWHELSRSWLWLSKLQPPIKFNFPRFSIVRAGDAIYVRVGDHDLTQKYGSPGAQTLRVATTYIHHNHNSQTLDNDIALLKLHGEADLKEGVCLVCLPARGTNQVRYNFLTRKFLCQDSSYPEVTISPPFRPPAKSAQ